MTKAKYIINLATKDFVYIEDIGRGLVMSITNDAEDVVKEVLAQFPNRRIFYKDSAGDVDELLHQEGQFTYFSYGVPEEYEKLILAATK